MNLSHLFKYFETDGTNIKGGDWDPNDGGIINRKIWIQNGKVVLAADVNGENYFDAVHRFLQLLYGFYNLILLQQNDEQLNIVIQIINDFIDYISSGGMMGQSQQDAINSLNKIEAKDFENVSGVAHITTTMSFFNSQFFSHLNVGKSTYLFDRFQGFIDIQLEKWGNGTVFCILYLCGTLFGMRDIKKNMIDKCYQLIDMQFNRNKQLSQLLNTFSYKDLDQIQTLQQQFDSIRNDKSAEQLQKIATTIDQINKSSIDAKQLLIVLGKHGYQQIYKAAIEKQNIQPEQKQCIIQVIKELVESRKSKNADGVKIKLYKTEALKKKKQQFMENMKQNAGTERTMKKFPELFQKPQELQQTIQIPGLRETDQTILVIKKTPKQGKK